MKKITVVCGCYGSGKTEFCLNFALWLRREYGKKVSIADYDVINPYFRSRERAEFLKNFNIDILGNFTDNNPGTDLPSLSSNIYGPLSRDEFLVIDLAGSKNGLKPLALISESLNENCDFLCVLNAFRPDTKTPELMINNIRALQSFSGRKITGIVHNSHLVRETTAETVLYGQGLVREASEALGIPIVYTQLRSDIYEEIRGSIDGKAIVFDKLSIRQDWI